MGRDNIVWILYMFGCVLNNWDIFVTVWGMEHNTILQFYILLFNNPVWLNHCSFTISSVHHIRLQHRASPESQSPEPGLSPGISNPPNRASLREYLTLRTGPPATIRIPAPGLARYC